MVFHWSLSDIKSPQVSRTLLGILAVLNNVVVWMVSTRPPTSKSSGPFSNPLVTVPKAPITIGIIVTFIFHSSFTVLRQSPSIWLTFSVLLFFTLRSAVTTKSTRWRALFFFLLINTRSGLLAEIRWSICTSKSQMNFMRYILWDGLKFVHVLLGGLGKF